MTGQEAIIMDTLCRIKQGTVIEIAAFCRLVYSEVSKRMAGLEKAGFVVDTKQKGKSPTGKKAIIWRIADGAPKQETGPSQLNFFNHE